MKLVRFGAQGEERPGVIDSKGVMRDLSGVINDLTPEALAPKSLSRLSAIDHSALPVVPQGSRLGCPISQTRQMIGVGLNYRAHAEEGGFDIPSEPLYFMKAISAINGPDDPVNLPPGAEKADWEIELGVVIGSHCARVRESDALDYVAGYLIGNDISERAYQIERGSQWTKGKSCETFAPLGPWLVTTDEMTDPQNLWMRLFLNGELVQSDTTANMIFSVRKLIECISSYMTLLPGDVILSGTPSGVGFGMSPQRFLRPGDEMRLEIEGLGTQQQCVFQA